MKINFSNRILTDEVLSISSKEVATQFIHIERMDNPDIDDVLMLLKEVRAICKHNDIKVKRIGYKKKLEGYKKDFSYFEMVNKYNALWDNLKYGWQQKIIDGVYAPVSDDEDVERLGELYRELQKMMYRSTVLSEVNSIYRQLKEYKRKIESEHCNYSFISL